MQIVSVFMWTSKLGFLGNMFPASPSKIADITAVVLFLCYWTWFPFLL